MNMNPFFAKSLRERSLQLSEVDIYFRDDNVTTVYTVTLADGRIGSFAVENAALENAVLTNTIETLLYPEIVKMEFHDNEQPVPPVPSEPAAETTDSANGGEPATPAEPADAPSEPADSGDSDTPAADDAGQGQESGQEPA